MFSMLAIAFITSCSDKNKINTDIVEITLTTKQHSRSLRGVGAGTSNELADGDRSTINLEHGIIVKKYSDASQGGTLISTETVTTFIEHDKGMYSALVMLEAEVKSISLTANFNGTDANDNVNSHQGDIKSDVVLLMGGIDVGSRSPERRKLNVNMIPEMARIEVRNHGMKETPANSTLSDIQFQRIFLDNTKINRSDNKLNKTATSDWGNVYSDVDGSMGSKYKLWATYKSNDNGDNKWNAVGYNGFIDGRENTIAKYAFLEGKSVAFNFFPQEIDSSSFSNEDKSENNNTYKEALKAGTPHVIVGFSYRVASYGPFISRYLNISRFKSKNDNKYIEKFEAGKVYSINSLDIIRLIENLENVSETPNPDNLMTILEVEVSE